ncbi:hypothetical protein NKH77_33525 [Streptomyces sp. M19]
MSAASRSRRRAQDAGQAFPIYITAVAGLLFLALAFFAVGQAGATRAEARPPPTPPRSARPRTTATNCAPPSSRPSPAAAPGTTSSRAAGGRRRRVRPGPVVRG